MKQNSFFSRPLLYCATAVLCYILASCAPAPQKPIKIGINQWPGYELFYLAEELGYFEKLGANVEFVHFDSLDDVLVAFTLGQVDMFTGTIIEAVLACDQMPTTPRIVMLFDYSNGSDVIITHKAISSMQELKGKKVASETSSLPLYMLDRALRINQMTLQDVNTLPMNQLQMEKAFKENKVDAVISYPPVASRIQRNNETNIIFSTADIPGEVVDALISNPHTIATTPYISEKMLEAWEMALHYLNTNEDAAIKKMANRLQITESEFKNSLSTIKLLNRSEMHAYLSKLDNKNINHIAENIHNTMKEIGVVNKPTTCNFLD